MKARLATIMVSTFALASCSTTPKAENDGVNLSAWAGEADDQISNVNQLIASHNKMVYEATQPGGDREGVADLEANISRLIQLRRYLEDDEMRIRRRIK